MPRGATKTDIESIFQGYTVHDVKFPPRGGAAIVFLYAKDADTILQKHPKGIISNGRKYYVSPFEFGKKKKKPIARESAITRDSPRESSESPANDPVDGLTQQASSLQVTSGGRNNNKGNNGRGRGPTFDVILKGLHYEANEANVRELFQGFQVRRVNFPQNRKGLAFVALPTAEEQQRATRTLSGLKVLGRKVFVEVVKPKA